MGILPNGRERKEEKNMKTGKMRRDVHHKLITLYLCDYIKVILYLSRIQCTFAMLICAHIQFN